MHALLRMIYEKEHTFDIQVKNGELTIDSFKALGQSEKDQIRLLKGHMPFGLHNEFTHGAKYFTLFRDPLERAISHYRFVHRNPRHYYHQTLHAKGITLNDYLLNPEIDELDNGQVRLVSGRDFEIGGCTADDQNEAIQNLKDHFIAVGIMERYDESLVLFKQLLEWKELPHQPARNKSTTEDRPSLSSEVVNRFQELNRFDYALYNAAKEFFFRKKEDVSGFSEEVDRYKADQLVFESGYKMGYRDGTSAEQQSEMKRTAVKKQSVVSRILSRLNQRK